MYVSSVVPRSIKGTTAAMLNLYLAILWFVAGIALYFVVDRAENPVRSFPLPLSALAALLCLYNLVRWWGWRTMRANRRAGDAAYSQWRPRIRRADDAAQPNPELHFSDAPPPAGDEPPRSPGPIANGEARHPDTP
jgi:hypothetical protein